MHIEAPKKTVLKSDKEVFDFLIDIKNFEKLMPENISKFEVLSEDKFLFALKGMPEIVLKLKEQHPNNKIILGAASDKLPFTLTADINSIAATETEVTLSFEGEFNAMMAMMIKGPITKFIDTLSNNLIVI
ncbi:orotate phosphoribosyltransferase [Cellulophaga omnivescoria]|uniref:orotate phosphoribosyltransferase n=1 Tax=Cellulophaga omnivescoria TaxID=1888890 RepID=UPI00098443EF|nr:orotate phosphoribosyltransferase [Cellulophaga omnivescoria]WBU89966.1 SRPBCC family protein [Cellulophaga omnivescoria]WKB82088.1 SRPBCC family protein [Cellulophaga lytica]